MAVTDLVARWASLNDLSVADQPFALAALASDPPAGAEEVATPNRASATFLIDATGQPSAIAFISFGGHWMTTMAELCRWLKLSAFAPPAPREDAERHFIVVGRPGAAEPKWLAEQL